METPEQTGWMNREAWGVGAYHAWIERFGTPAEAAARLIDRPERGLEVLLPHFGPVNGTSIVNIMGSNGLKAIALALLGAEVMVVDASEENRRYAVEVAEAAGVRIEYVVSDLLVLPEAVRARRFDIAFAEMGIVHYFTNLAPFCSAVHRLVAAGGVFVLRDFHPVSTKLISYRGPTAKVRKYKVTGNYFDTALVEEPVAFAKHLPTAGPLPTAPGDTAPAPKVLLRRWTLGEIVTAVAEAGFRIQRLEEAPNLSSDSFDRGIPKSFTLTANAEA